MLIRRVTRFAAMVIATSALLTFALFSQTSPGVLKGTVVDKDGQPLPGATVIVENPSLGVKGLGGITNPQGEYRVTISQPGKGYVLKASMPEFQKIEFGDIDIPPGRTIVLNVTLRPAFTQVMRVEGKELTVDTNKVETTTKISAEFISGLPVLGKDYQDVLTLAPGVTDVNNTGNPNIHGARDTDVVTLVDGVSTQDPFTGHFGQNLNVESIQEIEVVTSGASAEFGRAQGGFIKIITKSGGNEFKGSFKMEMRSQTLDGDGAGIDPTDVRGGLGETNGFRDLKFTDLYPYLSVSGAFIKDHLWYLFAPEYSQDEVPVNAETQAFVQTTKSWRVTSKVTWQIASNNHMAFTGIYDNQKDYNQGLDSIHALDTAYTNTRGGPTLTLQDTANLSPNLFLESTIARFDQRFTTTPALNPDTNGNGILNVDKIPSLGGNNDGFINLRERDPGEDYDSGGRFDGFEDRNHNGALDGCETDPITETRVCFPPSGLPAPWDLDSSGQPRIHYGEDTDQDGRLTQKFGCEGSNREDTNCTGTLDSETDLDADGKATCPLLPNGQPNYSDPACEDKGIPCSNPTACPGGFELDANGQSTRGNGKLDTEDRNGDKLLNDTPFHNWVDRNHNGLPDTGEFTAPLAPDQQYAQSFNTNRFTGPYFLNNDDNRTRNSLKEDLTYFINDLFGSHDIKIGTSIEQEGYTATRQQRPYWGINLGAIDPNTGQIGGTISAQLATVEVANNSAGSDNIGFYLQDNYKPLPNLSIGLGVRFDRESVNSHGYEFFDPAKQRQEYDNLQNLAGVEKGSDLNNDGVGSWGLAKDPLYDPATASAQALLDLASLNSALAAASVTRFTRHNFATDIFSTLLPPGTDPNMLQNGRPRQPQDFTITNNNLAPRLSVSWDPWADGKSKATASWGRFYDKLFLATVVGEEGPDAIAPYYGLDSDGVDNTGLPDNHVGKVISKAPPSANQIERDVRTPFTDEFTIGFQREIAPEVSVSVNYINRKFRDQLQDIDVNHSIRKPSATVHCATTFNGFCDDFGLNRVRPEGSSGGDAGKGPDERVSDQYPDLYINNFNFNQILRTGNYNYQEYQGIEMAVTRRLSRKWQMDANYTFSKATGQAESFNAQSGDDPSVTELKNGYLSYDQRHVAKFNATAYLPGDWRFGGTLTWSSGLPYSMVNRFRSADSVDFPQIRRLYGYRDPNSGYFIGEERNIHRNKAVYQIDVRTEKRFVMGNITSRAFFEVFNLLNTDDLRVFEIDNSFQTLQATEVRDFGRRFQVGIAMDF